MAGPSRLLRIDRDHPAFRPLWVRFALPVFCLGWAAMELATGAPFWAILFGAAGLYAGWSFFGPRGIGPQGSGPRGEGKE